MPSQRASVVLLLLLAACAAKDAPDAIGPSVALATPVDGSVWPTGTPLQVRGMVLDDADDPVDLRVEIGVDGVLVRTPALGANGRLGADLSVAAGPHELEVRAFDRDGAVTVVTRAFSVDDTPPLTAPALAITPTGPVTGDSLRATLVAPSTETDGTVPPELVYIWSWWVDGERATSTTPVVPGDDVVDGAEWAVTAYAFDGTHVSPTATASVSIGNGAPVVTGLALTPAAPTVADPLTCAYTSITDPEGDDVTVAWSWSVDGAPVEGSEATLPAGVAVRGQDVRCAIEATDARGAATRVESAAVALVNAPPVVTAVTITPDDPGSTTDLTCTPTGVSDADGDTLGSTWWWEADGVTIGTGPTLDHSRFARGDSLVCNLEVDDDHGGLARVASAPVVIGNAPPSAPEVTFVTPVVAPGHAATCGLYHLATDPDGDRLHYAWTWTVDGAATAETTSSLDTTGLAPGAILTCTAVASDGALDGPPASASLSLVAPTSGDVPADAPSLPGAASVLVGWAGRIGGDALFVGAPSDGAARLYDGDTLAAGGTDPATTWTADPASVDGGALGRALALLGDVDADGEEDLALGDADQAWIVYGPWADGAFPVGDVAGARVTGGSGDDVGASVAGADVDGDGVTDLLVGAPGQAYGGDGAGAVGVWTTGGRLASDHAIDTGDSLLLGAPGDGLGSLLLTPGDLDDDGLDDLVVGASPGGVGTLYVVPGGGFGEFAQVSEAAILVVRGAGADSGDPGGVTAATGGDLDGDGIADLVAGAPGASAVGVVWGAAGLRGNVTLGSEGGTTTDLRLSGDPGDELGAALAVADLDGDSLLDLILGAPGASASDTASGAALLYAGRDLPAWTSGPTARLLGAAGGDRLGEGLSSGVDVDADDYDEVYAIGAAGLTRWHGP